MLSCPVVGVVYDSAGAVCPHLIAVHDPLYGRSAVHHVVISVQGDVRKSDALVVLNCRLVTLVQEAHLLHPEVARLSTLHKHARTRQLLLVVEMQMCQSTSCLAEGLEGFGLVHQRQPWQGFLEVVGKGLAVLGRVQQAVDVVEDVLLCDIQTIESLAFAMDEVSDSVFAFIESIGGQARKLRCCSLLGFVVVERETLGIPVEMKIWKPTRITAGLLP